MRILEDMRQCCGCGACYNKCEINAINMKMNEEGFLEPVIDDNICIDCGKCRNVCPILNDLSVNWESPKRYAVTVADEALLKRSSSGGAFTLLAKEILESGGIVIGASYSESLDVHHVFIDKIEDLDSLRLSKYVQSNQELCYKKTKEFLENNQLVLYSGCPCQIAGLYTFLENKRYTNLYTIDLLCHSVPSPGIYKEHLEYSYGLDRLGGVEMRNRDGWQSCFNVIYKDGNIEKHKTKFNIYQKAFHKALISRPSCYNCKFAKIPRYGDITIGDNWNAKKLKLGDPYEKKSSLLLANNEHGLKLWEKILFASSIPIVCKDLSDSVEIEKLNKNVYAPMVTNDALRNTFYDKYKTLSFEEATYKTLYPYNVGLVLYMSDNYGSCATNYALYKAVEKIGFSPIILDHLVAPGGVSARFAKEHLTMSGEFMEPHDYKGANQLCDAFIVGSDQSLRWDFPIVLNNLEYILLEFAGNNKRKIGYAVSFGPERYSMDKTMGNLYTYALGRFDALSVREDYAIDMCKKNWGVDADWVLDPVFLLEKEDYLEIAKKSEVEFDEPYILVYIRHASDDKKKLIENVKKHYKEKIIVITDAEKHGSLKRQLEIDEIIEKVEFIDWLAYFANANYVITDSFHGTCFSLIFGKEYVSLKAGTTQRFDSLANMLGAADDTTRVQIFGDIKKLLNQEQVFKELEYVEIYKRISKSRDLCLDWLRNALNMEPCNHKYDENLLFEYAKLVKNKFNNDITKKYGFDEQMRLKRESYCKSGKTFLEAQRLLHDESEKIKDPITQIENIEEYFKVLSDRGIYTILICAKDTCAVYFDKFIEKTKLPLKVRPKVHNSYIAIISENKNCYEECSSEPLHKKCVLNAQFDFPNSYYMDKDDFEQLSNVPHGPLYVDMVSVKYDRKLQNQKGLITINNVNYSLDRRGVNVVVVNNQRNTVVDSFRVDLHADSQLKLQRK